MTIQKWLVELLKSIYGKMKETPKYLIDYKTFTTTLSQLREAAQKENATHGNDVFLVVLEELEPSFMSRKEARALARAYLAEEAQREAAALEKRLGGAQLESHPLFEKVSREESEKLLETLRATWEKLEEMEDGDAAKSLAFFLTRNASVLCVLLGDVWLQSALHVLRESCEAAVSACGEHG